MIPPNCSDHRRPELLRVAVSQADPELLRAALTYADPKLLERALNEADPDLLRTALQERSRHSRQQMASSCPKLSLAPTPDPGNTGQICAEMTT